MLLHTICSMGWYCAVLLQKGKYCKYSRTHYEICPRKEPPTVKGAPHSVFKTCYSTYTMLYEVTICVYQAIYMVHVYYIPYKAWYSTYLLYKVTMYIYQAIQDCWLLNMLRYIYVYIFYILMYATVYIYICIYTHIMYIYSVRLSSPFAASRPAARSSSWYVYYCCVFFLNLHICTCTHIGTVYICICIYTHIHIHIHTYIYIYMYTSVYIYSYIYLVFCCLHTHTQGMYVHEFVGAVSPPIKEGGRPPTHHQANNMTGVCVCVCVCVWPYTRYDRCVSPYTGRAYVECVCSRQKHTP
jgi:hypothetical protein